jgi:predicted CXXCH cytochrome family protein
MTLLPPRNIFWGSLMIGLGLLLLAGCGTPRERYQVLSVFFDGVPNPDTAKPAAGGNGPVASVPVRMVTQHKPYAEENCAACHRSESGNILDFSDAYKACVKCHAKVPQERKLMHGPVARGECRWCHAPHESAEEALFKDTPIRVCTQCHDTHLLGNNPPEHTDGKTSCLQCHFGHGGDKQYFLKPASPPASAPASQPDTAPALNLPPNGPPASSDQPATGPGKERVP